MMFNSTHQNQFLNIPKIFTEELQLMLIAIEKKCSGEDWMVGSSTLYKQKKAFKQAKKVTNVIN